MADDRADPSGAGRAAGGSRGDGNDPSQAGRERESSSGLPPWITNLSPFATRAGPLQSGTASNTEGELLEVARYPTGAPVATTEDLLRALLAAETAAASGQSPSIPETATAQPSQLLTPALLRTLTRGGIGSRDIIKTVSLEKEKPDLEKAQKDEGEVQKREPFQWKGVAPVKMAAVVLLGLLIRFVPWKPAELSPAAWTLFSIFVSMMFGLIIEPLPTGALCLVAATVALMTKSVSFPDMFTFFSRGSTWLIVGSFFFAKGYAITGLGSRMANYFVWLNGDTSLHLGTALVYAGLLVCPTIPSTSARASGIFMPVVSSISEEANSFPGPTSSRLGKFLSMLMIQANGPTAAMFFSGASTNILALELAAGVGVNITSPWIYWLVASSVPSAVCIILCPWIVYSLVPPERKESPEAPVSARRRLNAMGPMSWEEIMLTGVMAVCIPLWILGGFLNIPSSFTALLGLSLLLLTGVLQWKDCLSYTPAWDTLVWFSLMVAMSSQLSATGVTQYFTNHITAFVGIFVTSWTATFYVLHLFYMLMHYLIASQTAHIAALYAPFLSAMIAAGVPPRLGALTLAFSTNLMGAITTFSSGQAAVFYGTGYLKLKEVVFVGGVVTATYYAVFGSLGMLWWKAIGMY